MVDKTDEVKGMEFPCDITVKIFVEQGQLEMDEVHSIVLKVIDYADVRDIQSRPSKQGTYLAYSVAVHARSRELIDGLFRHLSAHPKVIMVI